MEYMQKIPNGKLYLLPIDYSLGRVGILLNTGPKVYYSFNREIKFLHSIFDGIKVRTIRIK